MTRLEQDPSPAATGRPPRRPPLRLGGRGTVGSAFRLIGTLVLDGRRVPLGPCWLAQTTRHIRLVWRCADGSTRDRDLSPEMLRQLLAEGLLQREVS